MSALAATLATLAAALPGGGAGLPAGTLTNRVYGAEVAAPSGEGVFVGAGIGDLPGIWRAEIRHTPLRPGATITDGTFRLTTLRGGRALAVRGRLAPGGVIRLVSTGPGCADQRYRIVDALVGVTPQSGQGRIDVVLVHHRHHLLGACRTYAATVRGTVTLAP